MRSKNAILNVITKIILQVIIILYGFIVPKIIITNFGSNVNGLISSITQFLAYIALLESGFGPVVKSVLYRPIAQKDTKTIENILKTSEKFFRTIAYIFLVYIIVLSILYPLLVSKDFGYIYTISLIVIISISTFAEYFFGMTYKLFLQAEQKNYIISIIQICTYFISIILIIILAKIGTNIQIIKLVSGCVFVLRPIFQNIYVKKKYNITFSKNDANYKLKNKWDGLAQHIASVIHDNTDITILTLFSNLINVSIYAVYTLITKGIRNLVFGLVDGIDSSFGDMIAKKENENLKSKFGVYETIYDTLLTIVYSTTIILIIPFVSIYTKDITDANYINSVFGTLIVISEYIFAIRMPYSTLTKAAGHFKETRIGAWIEAILNIVISIILVSKYGIIGVTIGTIVAMTIRTIEFIYHTNKYILKRNIFKSLQKILVIIIETAICVVISNNLFVLENTSYLNWVLNAIIIFAVNAIIIMIINIILYRKEFIELFNIFKRMYKKNRC